MKKLIALLLAVLMVASLLPAAALSANTRRKSLCSFSSPPA